MGSTVCIIGDSITGGVVFQPETGRYTHFKDSFVNLLGGELGAEVRNHSKFGCTVGTALARLDRYADDVTACAHTVIMLGGNDSDFDWPGVAETPDEFHDCNTPIDSFISDYSELIERVRGIGGRPVLMNMIPVFGRRYYDWICRKCDPEAIMRFLHNTDSIEHWNEMYSIAVMKLATKYALPLLDVRSSFLHARFFDSLFSQDGIHPSPDGHRVIFEYLLPQAKLALA